MQLKQRIKRIESKVKINYSAFCACENSPRVEIGYEDEGIQTIKNPIPDFCERCKKPIEKRQIIIRLVESREQVQI
jgi:hypothetical protein